MLTTPAEAILGSYIYMSNAVRHSSTFQYQLMTRQRVLTVLIVQGMSLCLVIAIGGRSMNPLP